MRLIRPTVLLAAATAMSVPGAQAQETKNVTGPTDFISEVHATVRAKYEYQPETDKGRFEVRNARLSAEGFIIPTVGFKAEIDLSDEGNIRMLDAYANMRAARSLKITAGQMRVPFTIDAHRSPHLQYFANRSFIAKQVGDVRDVGVAASWTGGHRTPVTLEGGIFSGSGLTQQKDYWTSGYNFSLKAQTQIARRANITLSLQKATCGQTGVIMYDAGAYWQDAHWHIEAEYLRKHYAHGAFRPVNAFDAFIAYRLTPRKALTALSLLGRYDYMSDHSRGNTDAGGRLTLDDPERHRLTGGTTLSLGKGPAQVDLRLNYEQYFYRKGATPKVSERNKFVAECVVHF